MNVTTLTRMNDLNKIKWKTDIIIITVVYGNQELHIDSLRCLIKSTLSETL